MFWSCRILRDGTPHAVADQLATSPPPPSSAAPRAPVVWSAPECPGRMGVERRREREGPLLRDTKRRRVAGGEQLRGAPASRRGESGGGGAVVEGAALCLSLTLF